MRLLHRLTLDTVGCLSGVDYMDRLQKSLAENPIQLIDKNIRRSGVCEVGVLELHPLLARTLDTVGCLGGVDYMRVNK